MNSSEPCILVAEDEKSLNTMICDYLQSLGFITESYMNGREALDAAESGRFDLAVLDIMMPGLDGLELTRRLRQNSDLPVIILTARATEADKLIGLELGADDYLTKPFSIRELSARIRAVLRRSLKNESSEGTILSIGDLSLDTRKRIIKRAATLIELTHVQFDILKMFMQSPGRVFSRSDILNAIMDDFFDGYERTVDVHIKNIRKALEPDPAHPVYLLTVWGVGYKLSEEVAS